MIAWCFDLAALEVRDTIALGAQAEPGRAVQTSGGRAYVVLRGAGSVLSFYPTDPNGYAVTTPICPTPVGITSWSPTGVWGADEVLVACESGELVSFVDEYGPSRTWSGFVDRDLRDVFVDETHGLVIVSTFRSAELLELDGARVLARVRPPDSLEGGVPFRASVAWRTSSPREQRGFALMLHQRMTRASIPVHGAVGAVGVTTPTPVCSSARTPITSMHT